MLESQAQMVVAEQMQDRCVKVPDVDGILDDVVAEVVRRPVDRPALDPAAAEPHREAPRMMVASVFCRGKSALRVDRAAKFAAPDHQRLVPQAAELEILDEPVARLIDVLALRLHAPWEVPVVIPVVVVDLDEANPPLDEAAGGERGVGEGARFLCIVAVEFKRAFGLGRKLGEFRHARLHPERHLILRDSRVRLRVADERGVHFIERLDAVERVAPHRCGNAGRVVDVQNGVALAPECHPGVLAREVAARPQPPADGLNLLAVRRLRDEHDERGQVLIFRSKAVAHPRAEAWPACDLVARLDVADGRFVVDRLGVHRADESNVVRAFRKPRQKLRIHPHAGVPELRELVSGRRDGETLLAARHRREPLPALDAGGQILVIPLGHLRLVVEEVHLRRSADHVEVDDALRLRGEMRKDGPGL